MTSVIHEYIYWLLKRKANGSSVLPIHEIHPVIKMTIKLPRKYQKIVIKEMEELKLLRKVSQDSYQLLIINRKPLSDYYGDPIWN